MDTHLVDLAADWGKLVDRTRKVGRVLRPRLLELLSVRQRRCDCLDSSSLYRRRSRSDKASISKASVERKRHNYPSHHLSSNATPILNEQGRVNFLARERLCPLLIPFVPIFNNFERLGHEYFRGFWSEPGWSTHMVK